MRLPLPVYGERGQIPRPTDTERIMIRIRDVDHLVLRVRDLEPMIDFYCNVIGCSVDVTWPNDGP